MLFNTIILIILENSKMNLVDCSRKSKILTKLSRCMNPANESIPLSEEQTCRYEEVLTLWKSSKYNF